MRKRYGPVCALSEAYARLLERLTGYDGLLQVAATMVAGIPPQGSGPSNQGVTACSALVADLERCQAGGLPPPQRIPTAEELAQEAAEQSPGLVPRAC